MTIDEPSRRPYPRGDVRMRRGFVIRDAELVAKLDLIVERERARHPGRRVSRESLARELLHQSAERRMPRRPL